MHPILRDDPALADARDSYADADAVLTSLRDKTAAAQREHQRKVTEALDRGEVYAPKLEPVTSAEVEQHVIGRRAGLAQRYASVIRREHDRLQLALEEREHELLEQAKTTAPVDLGDLAEELSALLDASAYLSHVSGLQPGQIDTVSRDVPDGPEVTVQDVVAAITSGTKLLQSRGLTLAAEAAAMERESDLARIRPRSFADFIDA